jgi:hypothetical protein
MRRVERVVCDVEAAHDGVVSQCLEELRDTGGCQTIV